MKRILALLLVLTMMISLLAGCSSNNNPTTTVANVDENQQNSEGTAPSQVLNWNLNSDPKTLDPTLNGASDGGHIINNTFNALVSERGGEVFPAIAESWEISADGLTYTFHLRESKWSDGSPLTAHDFVYGWIRGMDPRVASEYAWIWEYTNIVGATELTQLTPSKPSAPEELSEEDKKDAEKVKAYDEALAKYNEDKAKYDQEILNLGPVVEAAKETLGVKATDDHTLVVTVKSPTDYLLSLLSFYHFMPIKESAVEGSSEGNWAKDPAKAVSNGPFKLAEYKIGEGLVLVKNEHYWDAANVKLEKIVVKFIPEATTAYAAYQKDELQVIFEVPTPEIPKLIAESEEYHIYPLLGTYYYNFNLNLDMWKDPRVRRAFTLAIDRDLIADTLATGVIPAVGFVPPGLIDNEGRDFAEVSGSYGIVTDSSKVEEAKKLLAEAGYPDGKGFPEFTILYNTLDSHKLVAEMVQEMLKTNLGVTAKLQNSEWAVFQDQRRNGQYELARGGWITDYMDPSGLLSIFTTDNAYNDPKFSNSKYDELLSNASNLNGKEHFDALYQAQEILMTELPILPIYHYTDKVLAKSNFTGWDRSVLGAIDFTYAEFVAE